MPELTKFETADALERRLQGLNDAGEFPSLAGISATGEAFLAVLYEVGGEEAAPALLTDVPFDSSVSYTYDSEECPVCGRRDRCRRDFFGLDYPVTVLVFEAATSDE